MGRRRTFVVATFDFGGGYIKVTTININSVNLHTPEPFLPATDDYGGERDYDDTATTT